MPGHRYHVKLPKHFSENSRFFFAKMTQFKQKSVIPVWTISFSTGVGLWDILFSDETTELNN